MNTRSLWRDAMGRMLQNKASLMSMILILAIVLITVVGPMMSQFSHDETDFNSILTPPNFKNGHFFGTDGVGRDLFVRTLVGGRISLSVGVVATFVSVTIGVGYGAIAGYLGGRIDALMMRTVDILYAMPFMFFVILLTVAFGRSIILMFVAIGAVNWLDMARIVRGQTLNLKNKAFVEAALVNGASTTAIIVRHIVPNLIGIVCVYATLTIPQVILVESFLSFLGLGIQEPMTSWGALVNQGAQEMETAPWGLIFPGVFLTLTLFCFNFVGDGLRDAFDPKDR